MAGGGKLYASREAWSQSTLQLILICLLYSMGSIFFGNDLVQLFLVYSS
jgi:hypothetical protein